MPTDNGVADVLSRAKERIPEKAAALAQEARTMQSADEKHVERRADHVGVAGVLIGAGLIQADLALLGWPVLLVSVATLFTRIRQLSN